MKKFIILLTLISLTLVQAFSQESSVLSNKNDVPILPAAGDIGFGLSANPFFSYVGNMFNGSGGNNLNLALPGAIYGKYFLDSKTAVRLKLDVYRYATTFKNEIPDDEDADLTVTDTRNYVNSDLGLLLGIEKRRGSKRLQLFYGAELGLRTGKVSNTYEYGNLYSTDNMTPNSTINFDSGQYGIYNSRMTEDSEKDGIGLEVRAFAGLEYFILPKISIGGEFGLGYTHYFGGKIINTSERWDFISMEVETDTRETGTSRAITASDISSGMVFLFFYF